MSDEDHTGYAVGQAWVFQGAPHLPDGIYRIVFRDTVEHNFFLKRLGVAVSTPGPRHRQRALGLYSARVAALEALRGQGQALEVGVIEPVKRLSTPSKLKGKRSEIYKARLPILTAMLEPDTLLDLLSERRPRALVRLAADHNIKVPYARDLLRRLLDFGLDSERAAMTGHDRCGRKANQEYKNKQGRKCKLVKTDRAPEWRGVNADKMTRQSIDAFAITGYEPKNSFAQNYRDFKTRYAIKQIHQLENATVVREMLPDAQFISEDQFRYHIKRSLKTIRDALSQVRREALTAHLYRVQTGSARKHVPAPGYRLIIDSTVADVHLVCTWDRTRLIGRPTVYVVIDAATSLVVSLHVTLYPPSAVQAKIALYRALTEKGQWLSRFGLGAYSHLFPIAPRPLEIVFDRAELHTLAGHAMAEALNIAVGLPPPYMPKWKGLVERFFRTLNQYTIHWLAGSTKGRARERGERDCRFDAVLTMHEFIKLLLNNVLLWNLRGSIEEILRPDALADNVEPGPIGLWDWGLVNLHGSASYFSGDAAATTLLEGMPCRVGSGGIALNRHRWVGDWMVNEDLALSGLLSQPATIYNNPNAPSTALVHMNGEQFLRAARLGPDGMVDDTFSAEDIEDYIACEADHRQLHQKKTENFETTVMADSHSIVHAARRKTAEARAHGVHSKSQYLADSRLNREAERSVTEGLPLSKRPVALVPSPAEGNQLSSQFGSFNFAQAWENLSRSDK